MNQFEKLAQDLLIHQIQQRRKDEDFMARVRHIVNEDKIVLDKLSYEKDPE